MKGIKTSSRVLNSVRNFVTGIAGQALSILLRFVARTVFIRTLGKEYLGISGLFTDILTMLSLTELGMDTAIHYRMYKPLAEGEDKRIRVLLKFYKRAYQTIGVTIFLLGLFLIPALPHLIKDYDRLEELHINAVLVFVLYLLQSVSSYLFFAYRSSVVYANQEKYLLDIVAYIITVIDYIIRIIVLYVWKSFIAYLVVGIIASAVKNLVRAMVAKRKYPQLFIPEKDSLDKNEVIDMFKDCAALFTYRVNSVIVKATDNLVLSKFIGLAIVGVYSNYLMLYTTFHNLLHQIYSALSASLGNVFAKESAEKAYSVFEILMLITALVYGTCAVGVAVCADELIETWLSADYVIAQPFAILVGAEVLFTGMQSCIGQIRNSSGVFQKLWYRPLLGVAVNIVASILMVKQYGIYGVIVGTLIAHISTIFTIDPHIIYKYSFRGIYPVSEYYKKNGIYILILVAVGLFDSFFCSRLLVGRGWLSVFFHIFLTGISVPLAFYAVFRSTSECKYLLGVVNKFFGRIHKKNTV